MTVNMVTLPEPQSGTKRPKLTTPKNDAFAMVLLGMVIGKCEMPSTNISQENDHAIIIVKRQFVACNFR